MRVGAKNGQGFKYVNVQNLRLNTSTQKKVLNFLFFTYIDKMKQLKKKERAEIEKKVLEEFRKRKIEVDGELVYPETCEMGKLYSPEECDRLGIIS